MLVLIGVCRSMHAFCEQLIDDDEEFQLKEELSHFRSKEEKSQKTGLKLGLCSSSRKESVLRPGKNPGQLFDRLLMFSGF